MGRFNFRLPASVAVAYVREGAESVLRVARKYLAEEIIVWFTSMDTTGDGYRIQGQPKDLCCCEKDTTALFISTPGIL